MSQKRMFDKAIIDLDKFMDLPMSAKALYFLLGMEADDEGFVSYKKVIRIHGGNDDDIKILVSKNFLIYFPSGVVVITDWQKNNYLDKNRIKETEYLTEKKKLVVNKGKYVLTLKNIDVKQPLNECLTSIEESSIEENRREYIISEPDKLLNTQIAEIFNTFKSINPLINFGHKGERKACAEMIKGWGYDKTLKMAAAAVSIQGKPYSPVITNPYQLKIKSSALAVYFQKENNNSPIIV